MLGLTMLDIVLILALLVYLVVGLRNGFLVTLGGLVGFVAGAVAAFFAIPLVSQWVPSEGWRVAAIIATTIVLIVIGQSVGAGLGAAIRRWLNFRPLRFIDRLLGGAANIVVAALVMSMLAFSVGALGIPFLSTEISSSKVLSGITRVTPDPVMAWSAKLRGAVVADGIPRIIDNVAPADPAPVPNAAVDTPALAEASKSVVKIMGTAFQCGQNQTGSGWVAAPERVITNAHVVAGVNEPVVQLPNGRSLAGRVVHFDEARDIAVIAVSGMTANPLSLGQRLENGATAAFAGYPSGGPFQIQPARIQSLSPINVQNIYGANPKPLNIYTLAANVEQGNSGGPLLTMQGKVSGVIFAKSTVEAPVGYALSLDVMGPIAEQAEQYTETVSSGQCATK
ncbi:MarP family serine protease [Arthrobacter roseus]|uniref:MarP family serine protease n=1 Tax=Arthrobacter roseus TaxID=136274 RepID=UPI0019638F74|nr:S1-C subfamily serine protease [Arthrobacter roseus]